MKAVDLSGRNQLIGFGCLYGIEWFFEPSASDQIHPINQQLTINN